MYRRNVRFSRADAMWFSAAPEGVLAAGGREGGCGGHDELAQAVAVDRDRDGRPGGCVVAGDRSMLCVDAIYIKNDALGFSQHAFNATS